MLVLARALGMKVMLGCMTETSCAISAASHLSPMVDWADLDGALLISNDPFDGTTVVDGKVTILDVAGDWGQAEEGLRLRAQGSRQEAQGSRLRAHGSGQGGSGLKAQGEGARRGGPCGRPSGSCARPRPSVGKRDNAVSHQPSARDRPSGSNPADAMIECFPSPDGGYSSVAERRTVAPEVAGSNPVTHPKLLTLAGSRLRVSCIDTATRRAASGSQPGSRRARMRRSGTSRLILGKRAR